MADNVPPPDDQVPLVPAPASGPPPPPLAAPQASAAPPIFSGPVSMWLGFQTFFVSGILIVLSILGILFGTRREPDLVGQTLIIGGTALFVATNVMVLYVVLRLKSQRYTITRRLIEREDGIIIKRVDSLDLARVKDIELSQSLIGRMLNIGTIVVYSSDRTNPTMLIDCLPNPRPIYEQLRDAIMDISQRRGVVPM